MRITLLLVTLWGFLWVTQVCAGAPHASKISSKPLKIEAELLAYWDDLREYDASFRKQFDTLTQAQRTKYGERFDASTNRIPQVVPWWPLRRAYGGSFLLDAEGTYLLVFPVGSSGDMEGTFDGGVVAQFHVRYHARGRLHLSPDKSEVHDDLVTNTLELTFEGFRQPILQSVTTPVRE